MDFAEHRLSEAARFLRRQGVVYVWQPQPDALSASSRENEQAGEPVFKHNNLKSLELLDNMKALFHGKQSPVHSLWTYEHFNEDLHAMAPSPRLEMFRKIQAAALQHLGWPACGVAEWPLDLEWELFTHGVSTLRPHFIFCFGASPMLAGRCREQGGKQIFSGAHVYFLPNLESMAEGNQNAKNQAWKILQSIPGLASLKEDDTSR
ncbi:hypothetical protein MASR1M90_20240 [Desulfovibrionales bacterium]